MIYLDSAATTLQKPSAVSSAVYRAIKTVASPGRGGHSAAVDAANISFACRQEAAALFGVHDPEQVIFTFNATHALNIAIKSLIKPGDTVLVSGYEHNAVTRVLYGMDRVTVKVADAPLFQPEAMVRRFEQLMTPEVNAVICTHVSNVFGYILPMDRIAQLCSQRGIPLIVDASQSAGCVPVDMEQWKATFVAMPGHKGLYGPQGTGLLLCAHPTRTLLEGGTGSESLRQQMPDFLPDRLEAGTHNVHGIAGLLEGLRYVHRRGVDRIGAHETALASRIADGLQCIPGIKVYRQKNAEDRCQSGVLSFCMEGKDCEQVGELLAERGIAVRCGLHCAPFAHRTAGTLECGTVRASVSAFNTREEVDRFVRTVRHLYDGKK